jgi:transposase-like protein
VGSGHVINQEVRDLKRELQFVKQERDILKKAVAIFSSPQNKGMNS